MQGVSPVLVSSRVMFSRLFLPVGLTLICVWLGWAAARALVPEDLPPTPLPLTATPEGLPTGSTQVLILVVDDVDAPRPTLEGVWVATVTPGSATSSWVGFAPDLVVDEDALSSYFATGYGIGRSTQDAAMLVDAGLRRLTAGAVAPTRRIIVDHELIAAIVDRAGGITLIDQTLSGAQVLEMYANFTAAGSAAQMSYQLALLQSLGQRLETTPSDGLAALFTDSAPAYGLDAAIVSTWMTSRVFPDHPEFTATLSAAP